MEKNIKFLIVNHNSAINQKIENSLSKLGFGSNIKVAMNGGHAMMCLEHYHNCNNIYDYHLILMLNMNTPMIDGLEFLKMYQDRKNFIKENISIIGLTDDLSLAKRAAAEQLGLKHFVNSEFSEYDLVEVLPIGMNAMEKELVTVEPVKVNKNYTPTKLKRKAHAG